MAAHDKPLDYDSTLGHEMQVRIHGDPSKAQRHINKARAYMVQLVDKLDYNKIRAGEEKHELDDGTVIIVRQEYGLQQIDIYSEGEEEEKFYGIFSFKPRPDAPTAIIIESESENATDGIELYFDDRIQSGGIHTQDNTAYSEEVTAPVQLDDTTQRDNLYSIWMDARSTAGKNCASWSQGYMNKKWDASTYQKIRTCDYFEDPRFPYGSTLWYYGLTTRYVYVGGRLLYEASYYDDVLGVGEIGGELLAFILVNRGSTKIRLLTAPIPVIDYDVQSEDPFYALSDLTEVNAELIDIPDRRHPLSAFTFSSDGSVGSMSIYYWPDGHSITDYIVEFEVKEDILGEKELKAEVTQDKNLYVIERDVRVTKPVFTPNPSGGHTITTYRGANDPMGSAGDAMCLNAFGTPEPGCGGDDPGCCSGAIVEIASESFCGPGAHAEMKDWVQSRDPGTCTLGGGAAAWTSEGLFACAIGPERSTGAHAGWWVSGCVKNARAVHGTVGPVCGYAIKYETFPDIDRVTPAQHSSRTETTKTPEPVPFAQVMGPHGELIKGTREYSNYYSEKGTSENGYLTDDSSQKSVTVGGDGPPSRGGMGPSVTAIFIEALNWAYGSPRSSGYTYDSSYNSNGHGETVQKLPWRDLETIGSNSSSKSRIGWYYNTGSYRSYYTIDIGHICALGIRYTEIPDENDGKGTESAKAQSTQTRETFMEGDLRYEIACSIYRETNSESSGSSSWASGVGRVGSSSSSYSVIAEYRIEDLAIPGLSSYQKVNSTSSSSFPPISTSWMNVSDRDSISKSTSPSTFIHSKPIGLAFMAHPKGYALVSLSDKRFVTDMDVNERNYKVTLQFYNKKTKKLTDIIKLYNEALKPYNEYIEENGGLPVDELQTDINMDTGIDKGKLNQMGEFFGVLSRIPRPQLRFN